jgi:plastocyanin
VASALPAQTMEQAVAIGVWSDCVRPLTATVRVGQRVQWQAKEGIAPEIILDDGTSLGQVRHVLELTFAHPGTLRYHLRDSPGVRGTLVVGAP